MGARHVSLVGGRAVPSTPRVSDERASTAFPHTAPQEGVPHQPEPEPEPEPQALLRRGPLADGGVPLAVLSSIGAKWGQGFKSGARIDVDADWQCVLVWSYRSYRLNLPFDLMSEVVLQLLSIGALLPHPPTLGTYLVASATYHR